MTAEIAVMNKNGVALAADSKVTIGPSATPKTYDTVNKVFTLSKLHPVGIMFHGNAEFMAYPWEVVTKTYREKKLADNEDTIAEWAASFLKHLDAFGNIRPEDKSENISIILASGLRELVSEERQKARQKGLAPNSQEYQKLLSDGLEERCDRLRADGEWIQPGEMPRFKAAFVSVITEVVDAFFSRHNNKQLTDKAVEFAWLSLQRATVSPRSSGIVFAGYGDKEYFPTLIEYNCDGYIGDRIKVLHHQTMDIARDLPAAIHAFAQGEMVQRFMNGVDSDLIMALFDLFGDALNNACLDILERYGAQENKIDKVRGAINTATGEAVRKLSDISFAISRKNFVEPIIHMVALLPKDELPHLAESLVALTSLKRHVSRDMETVGGPIDVALISKGDGFIWIKRKHYFKPELNPQFARNYMYNIENGDDHARARPAASNAPRAGGEKGRPRRRR